MKARGPTNIGPYEVIRKIATGGMAELYLAKSTGVGGFEKIVAVKRILAHLAHDSEFIEMFRDEAKIAAALNHPNIVQVIANGTDDETEYIAMEYISGRNLSSVAKRVKAKGQKMPPVYVARCLAQACEGLHYAHHMTDAEGKPLQIIHRDVSPQNIIVAFTGQVKLVDFGIAKAATRAAHTRAGVLKGKYAYMSPEQIRGELIDSRSDLFAVGIVLYELVAGRRPFEKDNSIQTLKSIVQERHADPRELEPSLPESLVQIIDKALSKKRDERFQTAQEIQIALEDFVADSRERASNLQISQWLGDLFAEDLAKGKGATVSLKGIGDVVLPEVEAPAKRTRSRAATQDARSATPSGVSGPGGEPVVLSRGRGGGSVESKNGSRAAPEAPSRRRRVTTAGPVRAHLLEEGVIAPSGRAASQADEGDHATTIAPPSFAGPEPRAPSEQSTHARAPAPEPAPRPSFEEGVRSGPPVVDDPNAYDDGRTEFAPDPPAALREEPAVEVAAALARPVSPPGEARLPTRAARPQRGGSPPRPASARRPSPAHEDATRAGPPPSAPEPVLPPRRPSPARHEDATRAGPPPSAPVAVETGPTHRGASPPSRSMPPPSRRRDPSSSSDATNAGPAPFPPPSSRPAPAAPSRMSAREDSLDGPTLPRPDRAHLDVDGDSRTVAGVTGDDAGLNATGPMPVIARPPEAPSVARAKSRFDEEPTFGPDEGLGRDAAVAARRAPPALPPLPSRAPTPARHLDEPELERSRPPSRRAEVDDPAPSFPVPVPSPMALPKSADPVAGIGSTAVPPANVSLSEMLMDPARAYGAPASPRGGGLGAAPVSHPAAAPPGPGGASQPKTPLARVSLSRVVRESARLPSEAGYDDPFGAFVPSSLAAHHPPGAADGRGGASLLGQIGTPVGGGAPDPFGGDPMSSLSMAAGAFGGAPGQPPPAAALEVGPPPARGLGRRLQLVMIALCFVAVSAVVTLVLYKTRGPSLEIITDPPGARVFMDDQLLVGETPLKLSKIQAGRTYRIRIVAEGHAEQVRMVAMPNQPSKVSFKLEKSP